MTNNKQSSIEWLQAIELERDLTLADWNKAKAMHKEECKESYYESLLSNFQTFEHYYKETFGGNNEQQ